MKPIFSRKKNFSKKSHYFYIFANLFHVCLDILMSLTAYRSAVMHSFGYIIQRKSCCTETQLEKRKEYFNSFFRELWIFLVRY